VEAVVMPSTNISVSGGFIQSDKWVQLLCDILGKPLYIDISVDASSVGAAMLGFKALGIERQFPKKAPTAFYPDKNKTTYFEKKYELFASLYSALKSEFVKMKAL
jgi:gluconokinase